MANIKVRYVGAKESETDCVAGTGVTWTGHGDVQTVSASAWDIMGNHPDVWELVDEPEAIVAAATGSLGDATLSSSPGEGEGDPSPPAAKKVAAKKSTGKAKG